MADIVPLRQGELAAEATPKLAFKPKRQDWLLLEAFQAVIGSTGRLTNAAIASHLNITPEAVRQRLLHQGRQEWINEQLETAVRQAWPRVMARASELAMRGSIDHMTFLAKVGGRFAQTEQAPTGGPNNFNGPTFVFQSLVPRR